MSTESPETTLPACPFCGNEAVAKDGYPLAMVKCSACQARVLAKTITEAIEAWSRRTASVGADAAALAKQIAQRAFRMKSNCGIVEAAALDVLTRFTVSTASSDAAEIIDRLAHQGQHEYVLELERQVDLLYRMARHIRNTDEISLIKWGIEGMDLLAELRELDQERYDAEIKGAPVPNYRPCLREMLQASIHALYGYKYGNASPDLADEIITRAEKLLEDSVYIPQRSDAAEIWC